jgi:hypothetical protein
MPATVTSIPYVVKPKANTRLYCAIAGIDSSHLEPEDLSNVEIDMRPNIKILDTRECLEKPNLDQNGFMLAQHDIPNSNFEDSEQVNFYRSETERWITWFFTADVVLCFDLKVCIAFAELTTPSSSRHSAASTTSSKTRCGTTTTPLKLTDPLR